MTIKIDLKPEVEAELAARAQKNGVPFDQYVQTILEQYVHFAQSPLTPEERAKAFDDWGDNFPYRRSTPLPHEAVSRESFYQADEEYHSWSIWRTPMS